MYSISTLKYSSIVCQFYVEHATWDEIINWLSKTVQKSVISINRSQKLVLSRNKNLTFKEA